MKTDFITFERTLEKANIEFSSSFVHGVFCVLCCENSSSTDWFNWLVNYLDPQDVSQKEALERLNLIKGEVLDDLESETFEFSILAGQQEDVILDDLAFTKDWISGFLLGLEKTGLQSRISETSLSFEFIDDMREIMAHLDVSEQDMDEDAEVDLLEIQEYLRVGAMNLYYEVNQQ